MSDEEEIQAPQIRSTPYQSPMHNFGGSIILMTNPEQELFKLELTLRSQILDKEGNPLPMGTPLMNNSGICAMIGELQTIVNQVTVMSSLDKREIPMLMDFLSDTVAKDLMINSNRYGLHPSDRDKVYFSVLTAAFICMKRATSEGLNDKKFWRGSVQEISTNVNASQKRPGILSRIAGWGKKA